MHFWILGPLFLNLVYGRPQYDIVPEYSNTPQIPAISIEIPSSPLKVSGEAHWNKAQESIGRISTQNNRITPEVYGNAERADGPTPVPYRTGRERDDDKASEILDEAMDADEKSEVAPPAPPRKEDLLVVSTLPYSSESSSAESSEGSGSEELERTSAKSKVEKEGSGEEAGATLLLDEISNNTNGSTSQVEGSGETGGATRILDLLNREEVKGEVSSTGYDVSTLSEGSGSQRTAEDAHEEVVEGSGESSGEESQQTITTEYTSDGSTTPKDVIDLEHTEGSGENGMTEEVTTTVNGEAGEGDGERKGEGADDVTLTTPTSDISKETTEHYVTAPEGEEFRENGIWQTTTEKNGENNEIGDGEGKGRLEGESAAAAEAARQPSSAYNSVNDAVANETTKKTESTESSSEVLPTSSEEKEMTDLTENAHSDDERSKVTPSVDSPATSSGEGPPFNPPVEGLQSPGTNTPSDVSYDSTVSATDVPAKTEYTTIDTLSTITPSTSTTSESEEASKASEELEQLNRTGISAEGEGNALPQENSIAPSGYEVGKGSTGPLQPDLKAIDPKTAMGYAGIPITSSDRQLDAQINSDNFLEKNVEKVVKLTTKTGWKRYEFDCETEVDDKGELCKDWAEGGLCEVHRPTMFLFCRKTCLCTGPI